MPSEALHKSGFLKQPNWPFHLHALSQDHMHSTNSFQDVKNTSHINANTCKNIGVSAKIKIADSIISIRTKLHFHIIFPRTQVMLVLSRHVKSMTYQTTSKETQI
jgi:hypothetical protein